MTLYPFVSVCTPTFNRRPFIPMMIQCFQHQKYPKDKIEWIIVDDGTDKIEDLVTHIPQVKYFKYDTKLTLGKKRNILNEKAKGDIIIYMDDDDYYPPNRISHAVQMLQKNPEALCAGSSLMYIYFKHIGKMYAFGPYGPNHSTAATFAFRRKLLELTSFDETACVAEEKKFLKDYTIPFVQLDSDKSILVFSHIHNSFNKNELLKNITNNPNIHESNLKPENFIREKNILKFFMEDIDPLLESYEPGNPNNKQDVLQEIEKMKKIKEEKMKEIQRQQEEYREKIQKSYIQMDEQNQKKIDELSLLVQKLTLENNELKDKNKYLENKMKQLINERIKEKMDTKK